MSQSQTLLDMGFLPSQVCEVQAEEWLPCHQYVSVQRIFMNLRWISPRSPCGSSLRNTEMTSAQTLHRDHSEHARRLAITKQRGNH